MYPGPFIELHHEPYDLYQVAGRLIEVSRRTSSLLEFVTRACHTLLANRGLYGSLAALDYPFFQKLRRVRIGATVRFLTRREQLRKPPEQERTK